MEDSHGVGVREERERREGEISAEACIQVCKSG